MDIFPKDESRSIRTNNMYLEVSRDYRLRGTKIIIQGGKNEELIIIVSDKGKIIITEEE